LGMVHLRDNGMSTRTIIRGKGHARYFRLVKCKDSGKFLRGDTICVFNELAR